MFNALRDRYTSYCHSTRSFWQNVGVVRQVSGIGTVLVAGAVTACGVLLLSGVGPTPAADRLTGERLPAVAPIESSPATSQPDEHATTPSSTITSQPTASSAVPSTTATSSTSATTSTTTSSTMTSTTTIASAPSPLPLSVRASQTVVGAGGTVDFSGECPARDGEPSGPLIVWVIGETTDQITTGVTAVEWTYRWTAPTDVGQIRTHTFQFWCGDPVGWDGGYPIALQRVVDMVAQAGPASPTAPLIETESPVAIPETD